MNLKDIIGARVVEVDDIYDVIILEKNGKKYILYIVCYEDDVASLEVEEYKE